jgi:heat shock protein HslJ
MPLSYNQVEKHPPLLKKKQGKTMYTKQLKQHFNSSRRHMREPDQSGNVMRTVFPGVLSSACTLLIFIVGVATMFMLVSCTASTTDDLQDTAWELNSLSGTDLIPGSTITLAFSGDALSGSAGCNQFGGSYEISGDTLLIRDLFATEMACAEPIGILEQEQAFLTALRAVDSYQLGTGRLELRNEQGTQNLLFVTAAAVAAAPPEEPVDNPDAVVTVVNQQTTPTPTIEPTPLEDEDAGNGSATAVPPSGFKPYADSTAGVSLFLPESWVVTAVDPGRWAIFQSYPEDKYVGGEPRQPGDTKCDLNIQPPGTNKAELLRQWKANPDTTIVSEEDVVLESGLVGIRLEAENRGRSLSMVIDVHERALALTCFGDLTPFDDIAATLSASEILVETPQQTPDPAAGGRYQAEIATVSIDIPENWFVTGIVPGQRAVLQSYPDGKYVGGEPLQPGDTKCDLNIRPAGTNLVDFAAEMRGNTAVTILSESEIILLSGQPGIVIEMESMGVSSVLLTQIHDQVVVLNCYGDLTPFQEIAVSIAPASD